MLRGLLFIFKYFFSHLREKKLAAMHSLIQVILNFSMHFLKKNAIAWKR